MKLLVLENELTSRRGGQELSLIDVCEGLAARGHALTVAYVKGGDLEARYRRICDRLVPVRTYVIDRSRTVASMADFVRSLWAVQGFEPDIVYANQYLDSLFAAAATRLAHVPFVCHLRLPAPEILAGQYRIGMRHASRLIAISEQTRREWMTLGFPGDVIDVVHNGIDPERFKPGDAAAARRALRLEAADAVVTFAGRVHPSKGVEALLDAFARLSSRRPARLLIAGHAPELKGDDGGRRDYVRELKCRATALGIADRIGWLGHVADVVTLFRATDVVVVPSLWSEPFGRVIVEAMACGTPVVASRAGGIPEILTDEFARWMFEPGRVPELALALERTLDQRAGDPDVCARARQHVIAGFSLQPMVEGVERSLARALSGRPAALAEVG